MAYYAICSGEFERELLPDDTLKKSPKHAVPVLRLCRLASDLKHRRKGLGAVMLVDALRRAVEISRQIGVRAVEVDALSEDARAFYLKHGFHSLKDDLKHLYLPIRTAIDLFYK
jgi:GNAT superfamily N-acetyltransferase